MNFAEILAPEEAVTIIKKGFMGLCALFGFILGSHQGYIALWKDGVADPIRVFPYSVSSLPPVDQQALEEGIVIGDETELAHLLEDYLS